MSAFLFCVKIRERDSDESWKRGERKGSTYVVKILRLSSLNQGELSRVA